MSGQASKLRKRAHILRPALTAATAVFVCLTLFIYFLLDCSFFTGKETLTDRANQNLMQRECETAIEYLRAGMPNALEKRDEKKIAEYRNYFSTENSNFFFCFWVDDATGNGQKEAVLFNYTAAHNGAISEKNGAVPYENTQALLAREENKDLETVFQNLTMDAYIRLPLTAHDDFFRVQQFVRVLQKLRFPALIAFTLLVVLEGFLWAKLCEHALKGQDANALRELNGAPFYVLLLFYLLATANGLFFLRRQLQTLYERATFFTLRDVRPALYIALLLLLLLSYLTTLFVSSLCTRFAQPQWYKQSVLYRAVSTPSIERRLQMWLTVTVILEFSVFLLLFLRFSIEDGRLFALIDAAFVSVIALIAYAQARSTSAYMRATHRIALEQHGTVPTGDLHGKSLEHVQNINFLSHSAGEQTQLRFVNESFSTKLIHNVSHSLRDPLTAVTAEAERLKSGSLTPVEARESVRQINALSQELKKSIEDLLRIANASAEGNDAQLVPTDTGMMIEQAVGEFYDRFRQKDVELIRQLPDEPSYIPADGVCMWTVFESVLEEFLLLAVRGTRVFLQVQNEDDCVLLRVRGAVREDNMPARRSLALPTAKIFTEKQGGVYHDQFEQDMLAVEMRFPRCTPQAQTGE